MEMDPFSRLSEQEIKELALCGITSAEQLIKTDIADVLQDLETAQQYFPDKLFTLNQIKLEAIYSMCTPFNKTENAGDQLGDLKIENVGPTTGFRHSRQERNKRSIQKAANAQPQVMHSTVRTNRPWTTYFAALGTLLLIIPMISIFVLPVLMATNNLPDIKLPYLAILCIVIPCLPYIFFCRSALCPVCHIRIFSFSSYPRNRAAHYIPLLGYNIATALHIILFRRYICPGCGTPIRLTRKKSH